MASTMSSPIEKLDGKERIAVPGHLLSARGGDHYVLRVVGDSMVEEGIQDGDYVIVLRKEAAEAGEMVVCVVGDDASLKRYYPEDGGTVRLQPANKAMEPIRLPAAEVRIQGIAVGLMRKW